MSELVAYSMFCFLTCLFLYVLLGFVHDTSFESMRDEIAVSLFTENLELYAKVCHNLVVQASLLQENREIWCIGRKSEKSKRFLVSFEGKPATLVIWTD